MRYFNVAGADPEGILGEDHDPENHLIPLILQSAMEEKRVEISGTDYPTKDGTCVRDYVHVQDLARAHVRALECLVGGWKGGRVNIGCGRGYSVKEVISISEQVTGRNIMVLESGRREGDVPHLVADISKASNLLGWEPGITDLEGIIETAWQWTEHHPVGYGVKTHLNKDHEIRE